MNLLLVNDDGISSPGLYALAGALSRSYAVTVAAPDQNRSAIGHGVTLRSPLFAHRADYPHGVTAWGVSGTPADCPCPSGFGDFRAQQRLQPGL